MDGFQPFDVGMRTKFISAPYPHDVKGFRNPSLQKNIINPIGLY